MKFRVIAGHYSQEFSAESERELMHSLIGDAKIMKGLVYHFTISVFYTAKDGIEHLVGKWVNRQVSDSASKSVYEFKDLPKMAISNARHWENKIDLEVSATEAKGVLETGGEVYFQSRLSGIFIRVLEIRHSGFWEIFTETYDWWLTLIPGDKFVTYPPVVIFHKELLQPQLFCF